MSGGEEIDKKLLQAIKKPLQASDHRHQVKGKSGPKAEK